MKIVQIIPDFGLGGIQKGGCLLAAGLKHLDNDVWVLGYNDGYRRVWLEERGIECAIIDRDRRGQILSFLKEIAPDIVHVHDADVDYRLETELRGVFHIIHTPVFGKPLRYSINPEDICCVGQFVAWRLWSWMGRPDRGIFSVPITPFAPPSWGVGKTAKSDTIAIRASLGFHASMTIVGRLGRQDLLKWHPDTHIIVDRILENFPSCVWFSIGMPAPLGADKLKDKWGGRFVNLPEIQDFDILAKYLGILDVHVFASRYGECFSASITEGMGMGVPCVALVRSLGDTGEVEQITPGLTGYLAASIDGLIQGVHECIREQSILHDMRVSSRNYAAERWHYMKVVVDLEEYYKRRVSGLGAGCSRVDMLSFESIYESRCFSVLGKTWKYRAEQFVARTFYRKRCVFIFFRFCLNKFRRIKHYIYD